MKRDLSKGRSFFPVLVVVSIVPVVLLAMFLGGCSRVSPVIQGKSECLRSEYVKYAYNNPTPIRDADPTQTVIGPVRVSAEGGPLQDVILCLSVSHENTGDLDLWLRYDADSDGKPEASAPVEFYKGRADACGAKEPYACPMSLDGVYWFTDDGVNELEQTFAVFNGIARGGDFYLAVSDTLAEDVGTIANWSIYIKNTELLTCR